MRRGIFLLLTTGLVLLLLISTALLYLYTVDLLVRQTQERGFQAIARIHDALDETSLPIQRLVRNQTASAGEHIVIVDSDFYLLADSRSKSESVSGRYINSDLSDAKAHQSATSTVRNRGDGTLSVSVARMVHTRSLTIIVSVTFSVHQVAELTTWFLVWLSLLAVLVVGLVAVAVLYSLKRYRRPIRRLLQSTEESAGGGFSKIELRTDNPELSELAERFNSLVDHYDLIVEADNRKYSKINTLLANLKTGIVMVDTNNEISLINPRAEALLGVDRIKLFTGHGADGPRNPLLDRILTETRQVNARRHARELTVTTQSGEILDVTIEAIRSKYVPYEHSGALVIVRDVTEMRRLERLKDQFVSNVSHELRTPLTVIGGFVETLKDGESLSREDREAALDIIDVETERLKKLISELLLLSRISGTMDEHVKESFDPVPVIRAVISELDSIRAEKEIVTTTQFEASSPSITGVAGWVRQIMTNLYDNAIKYTPREGSIVIHVARSGAVLALTVEDSGPGIAPDDRGRIFDRFYQVNRSETSKNAGSGLGLSITKHMVDELGGSITVDASPLGGARFRVLLPLGEEPDDADRSVEAESDADADGTEGLDE